MKGFKIPKIGNVSSTLAEDEIVSVRMGIKDKLTGLYFDYFKHKSGYESVTLSLKNTGTWTGFPAAMRRIINL